MSIKFQLEDFIPFYHDYGENEYSNQTNADKDELYASIVTKKEFDELRLSPIDYIKKGELYKQQSFIARFISTYTLYDKMLVYHSVGTGKSGIVAAVVEHALKTSPNIREAIVLTRPALVNELIQNIAKTFPRYIPELYDDDGEKIDEQIIEKQTRKNVKANYQIYTFMEFAKEVRMISDSVIKKQYNNRIIIIDESHNLKESRVKDKDISFSTYNVIHRFLHVVQGCKIILLTATPMKDQPSEIVDILNLLLPLNQQLDKKEFRATYLTSNGFNRTYAKSFKDKYLRGMVSYVRAMSGNVFVDYRGIINKDVGMRYMKTVNLKMDRLQSDKYIDVYRQESKRDEDTDMESVEADEEDEKVNTLWLESRQTSMFVFPDGSYGKKGEEKYLTRKGKSVQVRSSLRDFIVENGDDNVSKLKQLKKLSVKFHKAVQDILENPNEKVFVYSNIVTGGGAELFSAILKLFGFEHIEMPSQVSNFSIDTLAVKNKFILVTGGITAQMDFIIDKVFNSPNNIDGRYVRVIIGSHVVGEGKTFKHVKRAYILTPFWNTPTIDQAVGRVVRVNSHTDFLDPNDRFVKIFRLVAIPAETENMSYDGSIDLRMYKVSEDKDVQIKSIERLLKESAVDCAINYNRNVLKTDVPFSKECDYMDKCNYECDYIDKKYYIKEWIGDRITDTYNLYYADSEIDRIKYSIKDAFRNKNAYDFYELYQIIQREISDVSPIVIARTLNDMIINNDRIRNRLGFVNFLREDRNLYFLTDDPLSSSLYTSYYYALYPTPESNFDDFNDILTYQQLTNFDDMLELLLKHQKDAKTVNTILENLSLNLIEKLIQVFLFAKLQRSTTNIALQKYILDKYKNRIHEDETSYTLKIGDQHVSKLSKSSSSIFDWRPISDVEMEELKQEFKEQVMNLKESPFGYYAIIDQSRTDYKKLKIVKVRETVLTQEGKINKAKERATGGQTCGEGGFQLGKLLGFYYILLMKCIRLNVAPPQISTEEEYDVKSLVKLKKFDKYLRDIILIHADDRLMIDALKLKTTDEIKASFITALDPEHSEDDKKALTVVNERRTFSDLTLGNIIEMMGIGTSRERLMKKVLGLQHQEKVENELKKLDKMYITMLGNALSLSAPELCPIIQEWFENNKLSTSE